MESKNKCPTCGDKFSSIGHHWSQSSCKYPKLNKNVKDMAIGLLMGDATLNRAGINCCLECEMISPNYLKYVNSKFDTFGCGVKLKMSASESAQRCRDSGFSESAKSENYNDIYYWNSMRHPELTELSSWYSSGKKVFPENLQLTPTVLKHWYCCDGNINNTGNGNIEISIGNEVENTEKIDNIFKQAGLPSPNTYSIRESMGNYKQPKCTAIFNRSESE